MHLVLFASCSSTPSNDNPEQKLVSNIIQNFGEHNYQNAKKILIDFGELKPVLEYYVSYRPLEPEKMNKVAFSVKDMHFYLDDLIEAQKVFNEGCKIKKDTITPNPNQTLEEIQNNFVEDDFTARCISKNGGQEAKQIHSNVMEILNRHSYTYFIQESSFDGKEIGRIFGYFSVSKCGNTRKTVYSTTKDVFECYIKTEEELAQKRKKLSEELLINARNAKRKENSNAAQIKQAQENMNGTTALTEYCLSMFMIKQKSAEIEQQKKIAKEVGMVDKQILYDAGVVLVDHKQKVKFQEGVYLKQVGKKPNTSMCSDTAYPYPQ